MVYTASHSQDTRLRYDTKEEFNMD